MQAITRRVYEITFTDERIEKIECCMNSEFHEIGSFCVFNLPDDNKIYHKTNNIISIRELNSYIE